MNQELLWEPKKYSCLDTGQLVRTEDCRREVIKQITRQRDLLQKAPVLKDSIQRRNPLVDPLSFIQLVLLKRLRAGVEPQDKLLTAVLESINGIAAGLKNAG